MGYKVNPKLGEGVNVNIDGESKKAGDKLTDAEADKFKDRVWRGMKVVVATKVEKSDKDK